VLVEWSDAECSELLRNINRQEKNPRQSVKDTSVGTGLESIMMMMVMVTHSFDVTSRPERGRDEKFVMNKVGKVSGKTRVERIFFY